MTTTSLAAGLFGGQSERERQADRFIHCIGISAGLVGANTLVAVLVYRADPIRLSAGIVYAASLLTMLGCSAAYHLARTPRRKEFLRRVDHAAIFLLIAGTCTPFIASGSPWNLGCLSFIWLVALTGMWFKIAFPRRLERVSILAYILLGWTGLLALALFSTSLSSETVILLSIGGVLYTAGILFHLWETLPFHIAIWHGQVVLAAGCHFWAVWQGVAMATWP